MNAPLPGGRGAGGERRYHFESAGLGWPGSCSGDWVGGWTVWVGAVPMKATLLIGAGWGGGLRTEATGGGLQSQTPWVH